MSGDFSHSQRIQSLARKQRALLEITAAMAQRADLQVHAFFREVMEITSQALAAPALCLHLMEGEPNRLNMVAARGLDPVWARAWSRLKLSGTTPPSLAFNNSACLEMEGGQAPNGLGGVVSVPINGVAVTIGTFSLLWPSPEGLPLDPDREGFLLAVGNLLGIAIEHAGLVSDMVDRYSDILQLKSDLEEQNQELARLNSRLEELSVTDPLTGLFNRRYFLERLAEEVSRSNRLDQPVTFMIADLDHFKRVNDELGHQAGDEALLRFSRWLEGGVRRVDTVARYGGEEFVALLVNCRAEDGRRVAEKLRAATEERSAMPPFDVIGGFTVSLGVAELQKGEDGTQLMARADRALYVSKQSGRNQVFLAS